MTGLGLAPSCEAEAVRVLRHLQALRAQGRRVQGGGGQGEPQLGSKRPRQEGGVLESSEGASAAAGAGAPSGQAAGGMAGQAGQADLSLPSEQTSSTIPHRPAWDVNMKATGQLAEDEAFYAEENARLVVDAEAYYR